MTDTSGPTSRMPFAYYDPDSSSLRMWQHTLDLGLTESSPTLPASGSMRAGRCYERPTSAPVTAEPGSSSLLPTPMVPNGGRTMSDEDVMAKGATPRGKRQVDLRSALRVLLPTPRTSDANGSGPHGEGGSDLRSTIKHLPTPRVTADRASRASLTRQGHWSAPSLAQAIELAQGVLPREYEDWAEVQGWHGALLPTPTVSDAKGPSPNHGGTTAEAIGVLTAPPSPDTPPSSGDQPPDLWTDLSTLSGDEPVSARNARTGGECGTR